MSEHDELERAVLSVIDVKVGDWVHVNTGAYSGLPYPEAMAWCEVVRVLEPWSAGVYPIKVQIPGLGIGQYKRSEIDVVRGTE